MSKSFRAVVEVVNGTFLFRVPSIRPLIESGYIVVCDLDTPEVGLPTHYLMSDGTTTFRVSDWELVHPMDWSEDLLQLNESFVTEVTV